MHAWAVKQLEDETIIFAENVGLLLFLDNFQKLEALSKALKTSISCIIIDRAVKRRQTNVL